MVVVTENMMMDNPGMSLGIKETKMMVLLNSMIVEIKAKVMIVSTTRKEMIKIRIKVIKMVMEGNLPMI